MAGVFIETDAEVLYGRFVARYQDATGKALAPADPRAVFLRTIAYLYAVATSATDFAAQQHTTSKVTEEHIDALAALIKAPRRQGDKSRVTMRFHAASSMWISLAAGKRVTDGTNTWKVLTTTESIAGPEIYKDALCECTATGSASNGVAVGLINTLVDSIPGIISCENIDESSGGTDLESLESYRARLPVAAEGRSTCGNREAYIAEALAISGLVADAEALGADDAADMAGISPPDAGDVFIYVIQGTRGATAEVVAVEPTPSSELLLLLQAAFDAADDTRKLTDNITVKSPSFVDLDKQATYYIGKSAAAKVTEIQAAAEEAFEAYLLWQESKIGRDVNPDELVARLKAAGVKRVTHDLTYTVLKRDESVRFGYIALHYGGLEDD